MNLSKYVPHGSVRNFSKPDYLKLKQPVVPKKEEEMGNYMVLSKHGGWVTIDDKSLNRKNAPEVLKVPMSETEKMKFKPTWMEKNL